MVCFTKNQTTLTIWTLKRKLDLWKKALFGMILLSFDATGKCPSTTPDHLLMAASLHGARLSWGIWRSSIAGDTLLHSACFQSYYMTSLNISPSAISWIGSIQIFLVYFIGTFSGRGLDAGYYHTILTCGSFLQVFAVFMTPISTQY